MSACAFEQDLLDAVASHRWPARADEALRAHVAACESCADLASVAGALLFEGDAAYTEAQVPSSAAVWHRAQLRAREEAARAATQAIGFVQGVAFACSVAAIIGAAFWGLPIIAALLPDMSGLASLPRPSLPMPAIDLEILPVFSGVAMQITAAAALALSLAVWLSVREHQ